MSFKLKFAPDYAAGNLGEPDNLELWQGSIDYIPDSLLLKPGVKILSAASGHGTEAKVIAQRMLKLGLSKEQVNESIWLLDSCTIFTNYAKLALGFKNVVTADFLTWQTDMTFDVVLSNPPYNRAIKANIPLPFTNIGPHAAFSYKSHQLLNEGGVFSVVLPCNFMCLPSGASYREWWLDNFEITNIDLHDNTNGRVFNIGLSDILTITGTKKENPDNTQVTWNNSFKVDLTKYPIWPMYKSAESVSIFDNVMSSKTQDIPYYGEKKDTPTAHILSTHLTRMGRRQNPTPRSMFIKDAVKPVTLPVWFGYSSKQQKDYQWSWMNTDHYAYVLSMVQSTPKNQPVLFAMLGEHKFKNCDFDTHFNVTAAEKQEIATWKQSFTKG